MRVWSQCEGKGSRSLPVSLLLFLSLLSISLSLFLWAVTLIRCFDHIVQVYIFGVCLNCAVFQNELIKQRPKKRDKHRENTIGNAAAANLWFPSWGTNLASPFVLFKWMDTMVDIVSSEHINSRHLSTLHRRQWRLWMWIFGKQAGSFHIRKKTSVQFLCLFLCYFSHSSILRIQCAYWSETASCKMPLFPSKTNYRCLPLNANT